MAERAKPKILCAGIAVQDIIMRVQNFPAPGTKVAASEFIVTGGGCAANAAVTIARLDGRVAFAGPLGGSVDAVSNRILSDLGKEGVDCAGVERVDGGTASVSLILLDATGEKTIATRRGVNLNNVLPKDPAGLVADASAVLVDNRFPEFVTAVCRAAQGRKIPIVIDLDQATKLDDPLLALGTHVVASTEALFGMTESNDYEDALKTLSTHLSSFVAITDGPKGVYWLEGGELRH
ncbi:MAG: PfkB family carbohydrate kinase, partial [Pseudolabrys sp.]